MSVPQQAVVHQGPLGWVRKGAVEIRHFVLRQDSIDYYSSKEEAANGAPVSGRLLMDDIEELDMTDVGFKLGLPGNRVMELRVTKDEHLQQWIDALTPFFENDSDDENQGDEVEEEVIHDSSLVVELQGKRERRHFWLFKDRLEYTITEDDQVPQDSIPLHRISGVKVTDTGFEVKTGSRSLALYCQMSESKEWVENLQQAYKAHVSERNSQAPIKIPADSQASPNPAVAAPAMPSNSRSDVKPDITQSAREVLYRGELGVCQKGNEESRYFVLFVDCLEYWTDAAGYLRGDRARGYVVNTSIVNIEADEGGFRIFLDSMSRLELRCKAPQVLATWLEHWSSILGKKIRIGAAEQTKAQSNMDRKAQTSESPMRSQQSPANSQPFVREVESSKESPNPNSQEISIANEPAPSTPPSRLNASPAPTSTPSQPMPDIPGCLFAGSLVINNGGKYRKRIFVLFDNRLDYFATPADATGERYPRGRILLRDISALDISDNGFQLNFNNNLDVAKMVLIVEPNQLPLWIAAWKKTTLLQGDEQQSPLRTASKPPAADSKRSMSPSPALLGKDVLIEGKLGLLRQHNHGAPEARYFVLFPDRLDCFIDEANARKGRVLESLLKTDIQEIDVVQGGLNIASTSRVGRPLRLRSLPGVQPSTENWIDAFHKVFAG